MFCLEFVERLELVLAPCRVIPEFIEHDDSSGFETPGKQVEDAFRRGIEITIDVQQRNVAFVGSKESRQGLVEPAFDQRDVARYRRKICCKRALLKATSPILRQSLEGIEAVDRSRPRLCDMADGAP